MGNLLARCGRCGRLPPPTNDATAASSPGAAASSSWAAAICSTTHPTQPAYGAAALPATARPASATVVARSGSSSAAVAIFSHERGLVLWRP